MQLEPYPSVKALRCPAFPADRLTCHVLQETAMFDVGLYDAGIAEASTQKKDPKALLGATAHLAA